MRMVATTIFTEGETIKMIYHQTVVAELWRNLVTLRHDGHMTATTKRRMNQFAKMYNLPFLVYQKNFEWFVDFTKDGHRYTTKFSKAFATISFKVDRPKG